MPWDAALAVFGNTSLPKYAALAAKLPNWDKLSPDCKGALVSLVYNRGASFSSAGARYQEMRNIKAHMAAGRFSAIPTELRSMKRIWAGDASLRGLLVRRDKEADLFERGLKAPVEPPAVAKPPPEPVITGSDPSPEPEIPGPEPGVEPPKLDTAEPSQPPSIWAAFFMAIAKLFGGKK